MKNYVKCKSFQIFLQICALDNNFNWIERFKYCSDYNSTSSEECSLRVDVSSLVPDTYDVLLVAYREIDNHSYDLDVVKLPRYKKTFDEDSFVNWNKNNWGYIKLPDISCN